MVALLLVAEPAVESEPAVLRVALDEWREAEGFPVYAVWELVVRVSGATAHGPRIVAEMNPDMRDSRALGSN